MTPHWRLAAWCAAWVSAGAALAGALVWFLYGEAHAGAFLYGASAGVVSFVSTALTVSLLTGYSKALAMMVGAGSFLARYGFAAVALGVPAYLGAWPVAPMLIGFAGVYLVESTVILPGMLSMGAPRAMKRSNEQLVCEELERRVEAR